MKSQLLLGQTLGFKANPLRDGVDTSVIHHRQGAVLIRDGMIVEVGPAEALAAANPSVPKVDHGAGLIMAGFVDAHVHYSQTAMIASWGKRLIDWLQTYTFPEEMRLSDPTYAALIAERFLDLTLANGTTTAACYCTSNPVSVDALFTASEKHGQRMVAGKVMMDRNAPPGLCDTVQSSYDDSAALITRWHGRGRLGYAITPRFAPTSSADQLAAAGALWAENPGCLMQTHLSEQREEIAWVRELYPDHADYLAVYEHFGLTGPGAIMGHAIHLAPREWAALSESGSAIAHCPTSNTFIGSGLFNLDQATKRGIVTGLATDVGGGSSFSMLRTMAAAYEIGQLQGRALHPAELIYLATQGAADTLRLGDKIGNLVAGREADLVVLDLAATPVIAQRVERAKDIWEAVFPTIILGDDRSIEAVYIAGGRIGEP